MKNYYEILEVNPKASQEVIEKAYRVLIRKYHPDLYIGEKQQYAQQMTKDINEAYHILSDDFLREQYNKELEKQQIEKDQNNITQQTRKVVTETKDNYRIQPKEETLSQRMQTHKIGSFGSVLELTKEVMHDLKKSKEKRKKIKDMTQNDITAIVLTIVIVIIIGIILWFIPFTNGWMRELLFENPLFSWIGNLFSK